MQEIKTTLSVNTQQHTLRLTASDQDLLIYDIVMAHILDGFPDFIGGTSRYHNIICPYFCSLMARI